MKEDVSSPRAGVERGSTDSRGILSDVVCALSGAVTLEDAGTAILRQGCCSLGLSLGAMWIADGLVLRCVSTWQAAGDLDDFEAAVRGTSLPFGTGLPGRVWKQGAAEWIRTTPPNAATVPGGIEMVFATPLTGRTGLLGVLEFFSREAMDPDPLLSTLAYLSDHVGPFVERWLTEEALRRSEARYHDTFSHAPLGIAHTAEDGHLVAVNERLAQMLGYSVPEMLRMCLRDIAHPDDLAKNLEARRRVLAGDVNTYTGEHRYLRKDGLPVWMSLNLSLLPGSAEAPRCLIAVLADISQRKQMERDTQEALVHERLVAQTLAQSFLGRVPVMPGLDIAALYQPASLLDGVGGDYYDFISLDERRFAIVLGDVSGKGLAAAVYTGMVKYMLHAFAFLDGEPCTVARRLNEALYREMRDASMFVSLVYAVLDTQQDRLTWVNGGHPPPVLYDASRDSISRLSVTGGLLGASRHFEFTQGTVHFPPGSQLVLFTDGVSEAAGRVDPLSDGGVGAALSLRPGQTADQYTRAIFDHVCEVAGDRLRDDVAIVVVRRVG